MKRTTPLILGLVLSLAACGDPCERLQDEMQEIQREIAQDPESAMDRAEELEKLGQDYQRECLGTTG